MEKRKIFVELADIEDIQGYTISKAEWMEENATDRYFLTLTKDAGGKQAEKEIMIENPQIFIEQ